MEEKNYLKNETKIDLILPAYNEEESIKKIQERFVELVRYQAGKELSDYNLRKIGSDLEAFIRKMLQAGELSYNPDCRVLNYSMGLPRTPDLL